VYGAGGYEVRAIPFAAGAGESVVEACVEVVVEVWRGSGWEMTELRRSVARPGDMGHSVGHSGRSGGGSGPRIPGTPAFSNLKKGSIGSHGSLGPLMRER